MFTARRRSGRYQVAFGQTDEFLGGVAALRQRFPDPEPDEFDWSNLTTSFFTTLVAGHPAPSEWVVEGNTGGMISHVRLTRQERDGWGPLRSWIREKDLLPRGADVGELTRAVSGIEGKGFFGINCCQCLRTAAEMGLSQVILVCSPGEPYEYYCGRLGFKPALKHPLTLEKKMGVVLNVRLFSWQPGPEELRMVAEEESLRLRRIS